MLHDEQVAYWFVKGEIQTKDDRQTLEPHGVNLYHI